MDSATHHGRMMVGRGKLWHNLGSKVWRQFDSPHMYKVLVLWNMRERERERDKGHGAISALDSTIL